MPTLTLALKRLAKLGIAREITRRNYSRIYAYDKQLNIVVVAVISQAIIVPTRRPLASGQFRAILQHS